jgi:hypothetical protein
MVYFEGNLLIDQVQGHHNMLEQIVNNYAGMFLAFASVIGILIIYKNFRGSKFGWPAMGAGIISAGFIGLGDAGKNLITPITGINPFPHESLHYLGMMGGPVALFLLYTGLKEYTATEEIKPLTKSRILLILMATLLIPVALATQADQRLDPDIEGPFLLVTVVPTIIIAVLLLIKAGSSFEEYSTVVLNVSFVAVATTLLTIGLLLARMGDVQMLNNAELYVNGNALVDIMHAVTATTIVTFGISTEGLVRSM